MFLFDQVSIPFQERTCPTNKEHVQEKTETTPKGRVHHSISSRHKTFPPCFCFKNRYKRNPYVLKAASCHLCPVAITIIIQSLPQVIIQSWHLMSQGNIKETTCLTLQNLQNGLLHTASIFLRKPTSYESAKSGVQNFPEALDCCNFCREQAAGEVEANIAVQVCRQKEIK